MVTEAMKLYIPDWSGYLLIVLGRMNVRWWFLRFLVYMSLRPFFWLKYAISHCLGSKYGYRIVRKDSFDDPRFYDFLPRPDGTPSSIPRQPSPYQVRAANADVDDVRDGLARVPFPFTTPDTLAQSREMSSAQTPEYKPLFKSIITSASLHLSSNFQALREAY